MTEPIKQEIINNIFENGDKLITGPILQTVLIDMIDDVNVKDQEILSKTGSWDDAATQIPNLATKAEVTNLSESIARDLENVVDVDLTGYATEQWVESQGYLKEHQDISGLATKTELTEAKDNLQGNITSLSESVARDLANVDVDLTGYATEAWVQSQDYASKSYVDNAVSSSSVDLTGYATETWVESQGYLKEHQDISNLATKGELNDTKNNLQGNITSLSESVARDLANVDVDLTGYATETWVQSQGYLTEHQDISGLATKSELTSVSESIQTDISNLATKTELTSVSESVQTDITNLSKSVANSVVWKKGTGKDSIAQIIADGTDLPTATGDRAIATGKGTKASSWYSHAEGWNTTASGGTSHAEGYGTKALGTCGHAEGYGSVASGEASHAEGNYVKATGNYSHAEGNGAEALGNYSHAEGDNTVASGSYSHAEGTCTITSNDWEHAEGINNHSSANQIFSVGAGDNKGGKATRRNALSVLVVPNSETQINTASVFVQNVGGYDGTNPLPGANDLATVINGLSSGGGSSSGGSSETIWKKGTGKDSAVLILTGDDEAKTPTATGTGSIAIGFETTASGDNSHAEGWFSKASGQYSHAEGYSAKASGDFSHAEGYGTLASGQYSHAEGTDTDALGMYSHAEGNYTDASAMYSHAEGYFTITLGDCSHAEGDHTKASGSYSHAEGNSTLTSNEYEHAQGRYNYTSSNQIFSIGTGNSNTDRRNVVSVLEVSNNNSYTGSVFVQNVGGYDGTNPTPGTNDLATVINGLSSGGGSSETLWKKGTAQDSIVQVWTGDYEAFTPTASGTGAVAMGVSSVASGWGSHAEGAQTKASGQYSHAEGYHTEASNSYSHAEGYWTKASGKYSHAEGNYTNASGQGSHAEGESTNASGSYSHAEGYGTITSNDYEHAQGRYNHSSENQIFSVGAGEEKPAYQYNRRNAISVLAVDNSGSYTSSFFVQNIGGYDGTNPEPGANDLATVLNNTETWTFTLEDGSTVTKNIRIA